MSAVWLVGAQDYESCDVVAVFAVGSDAKAFGERCAAHDAKYPVAPQTLEDTPENDAEYERYFAACDRWTKRHPGKRGSVALSYPVWRMKVRAASPAATGGDRHG